MLIIEVNTPFILSTVSALTSPYGLISMGILPNAYLLFHKSNLN